MSVTSESSNRLTDAQVGEVLALAKDADSVELKLTVRPPELSMRLVAELWFYPDSSTILEPSG